MFDVMVGHSPCLEIDLSNEQPVGQGQFPSADISEIETQTVSARKYISRRRVVKLRNVLYLKSSAEETRLKRPLQVYQIKLSVATQKYMSQIQIAMPKPCFVKTPDKIRQPVDKFPPQPDIPR